MLIVLYILSVVLLLLSHCHPLVIIVLLLLLSVSLSCCPVIALLSFSWLLYNANFYIHHLKSLCHPLWHCLSTLKFAGVVQSSAAAAATAAATCQCQRLTLRNQEDPWTTSPTTIQRTVHHWWGGAHHHQRCCHSISANHAIRAAYQW
jgi:hypothetical protein